MTIHVLGSGDFLVLIEADGEKRYYGRILRGDLVGFVWPKG